MQVMSKIMYSRVREIEEKQPVHRLNKQKSFRCYAEKYANEIREMCSAIPEREWASRAGFLLLEKTGNSVFREDRDDVQNSWRTTVKNIVRLEKSPPPSLDTFTDVAVAHDNLISTLNNELADLKDREKEIKRTLRALNEFKP